MLHHHWIVSLISAFLFFLLFSSKPYLVDARALDDAIFLDFHGTKVLLARDAERLNTAAFECPGDGFFPVGECDPYYYVCLDGAVYPAVCPGTGIFDPATSNCVDYAASSCATTTAFTGSTPPGPIKCETDGFYAFGDCLQSFYFCSDGVPFYEECPSGLVFVESLQTCKTPEEAGCPDSTTSTTSTTTEMTTSTSTTSTTTEITSTTTTSTTSTPQAVVTPNHTTTVPPDVCVDKPNGFYAYGHCKEHYYICSQGLYIDQACPNGLFYDEFVGTCSTESECLKFKCPNATIAYYPISPGACTPFYYTCYEGEAYPGQCPYPNVFNESLHACSLNCSANSNNIRSSKDISELFNFELVQGNVLQHRALESELLLKSRHKQLEI